jgi:diaminopimelate decarboxylase
MSGTQAEDRSLGAHFGVTERGHLSIDGCDTVELVERFGAPLWAISDRAIRTNVVRLAEAFGRAHPRTRVVYASKANPQPAVVRAAHEAGAWVDAVTMGHLVLLERAGIPPQHVVLNGNAKTEEELRWALDHGAAYVNADHVGEVATLARLQPLEARPVAVCLRLATDPDRFDDDPAFAADERGSKFGMTEAELAEAAVVVHDHPGLELAGIHNHVGFPAYGIPYSAELDLRRHGRAAAQVAGMARRLRDQGLPVRTLNLGGGFRVPKRHGFGPEGITDIPAADAYAEALAAPLREAGLDDVELLLEAGGYVISDAVILLARVVGRKLAPVGEDWVFVRDTSAYHFVRALMYGFRHHTVVANRVDEPVAERVRIAGPVCTTDSLIEGVDVPRLEPDDLVAVLDQGAYCEAVTSDYCAIPIPAAVMVSDGRAELVRRRETIEDLVGRFGVPSWLASADTPSVVDP